MIILVLICGTEAKVTMQIGGSTFMTDLNGDFATMFTNDDNPNAGILALKIIKKNSLILSIK
jgi:hypothetical protein